jgi:HAD superfamily hydrolase (TIGR01490 family)
VGNAEVVQTLGSMTTLGEGGWAFFDLDRTVVAGSSLARFGRVLFRSGELSTGTAAWAMARELVFARWGASDSTVERLQRRLLALAAGRDHERLRSLASEAAIEASAGAFASARWLLDQHAGAGVTTVIVSASPHDLVAMIASVLGADAGVGTKVEVVDGVLTGRLAGPLCYGAGKLDRLIEELPGIDWRAAVAYSDSASDLPLLTACATAVAANPDRRLRAVARAQGWPVVRLT